jgi:hypothetical protein
MQMTDIVLNREKRALDNDKLMTKRALEFQQNLMANELLGSMGNDINDVLSGKVKVKLSFWEKMKYKVNFWIDKLFKLF